MPAVEPCGTSGFATPRTSPAHTRRGRGGAGRDAVRPHQTLPSPAEQRSPLPAGPAAQRARGRTRRSAPLPPSPVSGAHGRHVKETGATAEPAPGAAGPDRLAAALRCRLCGSAEARRAGSNKPTPAARPRPHHGSRAGGEARRSEPPAGLSPPPAQVGKHRAGPGHCGSCRAGEGAGPGSLPSHRGGGRAALPGPPESLGRLRGALAPPRRPGSVWRAERAAPRCRR